MKYPSLICLILKPYLEQNFKLRCLSKALLTLSRENVSEIKIKFSRQAKVSYKIINELGDAETQLTLRSLS